MNYILLYWNDSSKQTQCLQGCTVFKWGSTFKLWVFELKKIKTNNDYNSRYKHESNKRTTIQYANTVLP